MAKPIAKIPLKKIKVGINWVDQERIIVHHSKKGEIRACRNVCRHMYGLFVEQGGSELICMRHGWTLDPATMTYNSPAAGAKQEELLVEITKTHVILYDAPEQK